MMAQIFLSCSNFFFFFNPSSYSPALVAGNFIQIYNVMRNTHLIQHRCVQLLEQVSIGKTASTDRKYLVSMCMHVSVHVCV